MNHCWQPAEMIIKSVFLMPNQEILFISCLDIRIRLMQFYFLLMTQFLSQVVKITHLEAWDLKTFKCVRTLENVPGSLDILLAQNFVIAGNVEGELRFFRVSF